MRVIFFYGITFNQDQCRPRLLFKNVEAYRPSVETAQRKGFDSERWYAEFFLDEGIDHLEGQFENESDPILIGRIGSDYEDCFYLGIRDTFHMDNAPFELEKVEKDEWNELIREKCDELGIQWEIPRFHLIAAVTY